MPTVIDFLTGATAHPRHGRLEAILGRDDDWWDAHHDFIQWVFPTDQISSFNPSAPRIAPMADPAPTLTDARYARFSRYLVSYPAGHNWLRITRALRHARLIGRIDLQGDLYRHARDLNPGVPAATDAFWRAELQ